MKALRRNKLDGRKDRVFVQSFEIRNLERLNREIDTPLVQQFFSLGVDGLFSDNPDTGVEARSGP